MDMVKKQAVGFLPQVSRAFMHCGQPARIWEGV